MTKKKTEEALCSYDPETKTEVLCEGMKAMLVGHGIPTSGKIKPGLYIYSNQLHMPSMVLLNRGPCIYGPNQKGRLLSVCPFCESDLAHNWHKPLQEWFEEKVEPKVNTEKAKAS